MVAALNERICKFGPDNALLGILTEPQHAAVEPDFPDVILLNAGLLHHVGQNRLNVLLARRLANSGYATFRFDFSGIGDSRQQTSAAPVRERNIKEIQEVIDYLERSRGKREFVLIGLCTGADNAHRAAVADPRVRGIVMLDGYSYPTATYFIRRFHNKLFGLSHWRDFLAGRIRRWISRSRRAGGETAESVTYFWILPKKSQAERELQELVRRGVRMLQVFSGSNIGYNYPAQYADSFRQIDFDGLLQVSYIEDADHTYSMQRDRRHLTSVIASWFDTEFPATDLRVRESASTTSSAARTPGAAAGA
jgi:pimeloyl-ACP methyl ester carboxylesterase